MSSLLEEAIVDAKALKEAALKNAENAVLEKYSIEVKDALSTLLEQDEFGFDDGVTPADTSFTDEVPFAFQNEELEAPPENELIEIDFDALKARIAEEEDQGMEAAPEELMSSEEMALQLEQETDTADTFLDPGEASGDPETAGETAEDMASTGSAEDAAAEEASHAIQDNPKNALEESDDEDIAFTEEMLSDLIEELVVDMTPRPQGWSAEGSAYNSIIQANDEAMASAQGAHLEEEEIEEDVDTAPDVVSDAELYEAKIAQLTESTKEFRALLIEAKNQLTKLNLDNAKLVYQNKALNSASLNERQKHKIVEAVQSANSVEEANMIFETIQNAVGISDSKNNSRPQTLREAVQRPVSLLLNSKKNNEATHDPKLDRMLRLAGLNK